MNQAQELLGTVFQNPVLLASGICGYGQELDRMLDLDQLGGLVTKALTLEPRSGNPPLRTAGYDAGMLNAIGLANVGLDRFVEDKLPWLRERLKNARVLINVAGAQVHDYVEVVEALDGEHGFVGFELNVSCPNVKRGGAMFSSSEDLLSGLVSRVRAATGKPLLVKLAPNVADIGRLAEVAVDAGADGLTLINTFPGLLFDVDTRRPLLGNGNGGVSGPGVLPMGVYAVWQARTRVSVPLIGVGGIRTGEDVVQYLLAGASLVQMGTATLADPRSPIRVLAELRKYCAGSGVGDVAELVGGGILD